jgi:hypothetical protein
MTKRDQHVTDNDLNWLFGHLGHCAMCLEAVKRVVKSASLNGRPICNEVKPLEIRDEEFGKRIAAIIAESCMRVNAALASQPEGRPNVRR